MIPTGKQHECATRGATPLELGIADCERRSLEWGL